MRGLILGAGPAVTALALMGASAGVAGAQPAPACTPVSLGNSAMLAGAVTVSPVPGSRDASAQTQVSFAGVPARELSVIDVVGSRSGRHRGRLLAYSQGDGASFVPSAPFGEGERVTVRARWRGPAGARVLSDTFATAQADPIDATPEAVHPGLPSQVQGFHSRPDLHPPVLTVTASSPAVAAGDEFLAPYAGPGQAGPMILDPSGSLVWFQPLPRDVVASNFRVQEYGGRPVLTWWQGDISVHGFGLGTDLVLDSTYRTIARVRAANGLQADLHEFQLTPEGTALITAYDPIRCDLSGAGGPADGALVNGVIQEIDVKTGLVRMQWTSLDHVALSESYEHISGSPASPYDFFHINSINVDRDGSLLVSARNTWTVYDLDRRSGQIVWRLGGRQSSFSGAPQTRTAWQHDPRELPDGSISIFDNGSSPNVHGQSRGIVVRLDLGAHTVSLSRQLVHPPALIADSQGNLQALPDGNWFIGWGQVPDFSEYGSEGQLLLDAHFPAHTQSYRAFSFPWTALPPHRPAMQLVPPVAGGPAVVYASWNGATLVSSWRVLAGSSPTDLAPAAQAVRSGFETAIPLPSGAPGPYMEVEALDASGRSLGVSAPTH